MMIGIRRRVTRFGGMLGVAILSLTSLTSCTPDQDLTFYSNKVYHTSMSSFTTWWKNDHAAVLGVSVAQINTWWDLGIGLLDQPLAKDAYWDMSTDFCSNSPDTGAYFNFKAPCVRHDFSWRNLKKMDRRHKVSYFNTKAQRVGANQQFETDMKSHCATRSAIYKTMCNATAKAYYEAVMAAA